MTPLLPVSFADVVAARDRISPFIHKTPVLTSRTLDSRTGSRVFLKAEIFQRIGAFKVRGAFSRLTLLSPEERRRGVVAFSSGNHAQAVALAARELGIPATIVMPDDAPRAKLDATRGYGAEVVIYARSTGAGPSREELARRIVDESGAVLVPPFDDRAVIAGQGTLAVELLEEVPDLDILITPCGGGGLLSGCCVAAAELRPGIRLYGVEPEAGDDVRRSLEKGEPVTIPVPATIADSLQTTRVGNLTFAILRELASGIVTVPDRALIDAVRFLVERLKLVVEPGGAAALAALLSDRVPGCRGLRAGVVLSGGNVDLDRLGDWLVNEGG